MICTSFLFFPHVAPILKAGLLHDLTPNSLIISIFLQLSLLRGHLDGLNILNYWPLTKQIILFLTSLWLYLPLWVIFSPWTDHSIPQTPFGQFLLKRQFKYCFLVDLSLVSLSSGSASPSCTYILISFYSRLKILASMKLYSSCWLRTGTMS